MPTEVAQVPAPPPRPDESHKGTFGRVLIVAGSRGMSGAACLSGLGALRGGAGLVDVAVPESILPIVAAVEPSYLTVPLPDSDGRIAGGARPAIARSAETADAIAFGPGWGRSDALDELARTLYTSCEKPCVVDADGLNALSESRDVLGDAPAPRVLTPHPGEFARLSGASVEDVQGNRLERAAAFADAHGVILVLKGHGTIVTDGERYAVNTTGNSGLATGGTGDVLTGLIAALLASGMDPFDAARFGVHLHGRAADLAVADTSRAGLIASDLPRYLGRAWLEYERTDSG